MKCRLLFSLIFFLTVFHTNAQLFEVEGEVIEEWGEPIFGATIRVKNRSNGAISNWEGKFHIQDSVPIEVLEVSRMGYQTEEIEVKGRPYLKIELKEDEFYDYPDAYDYFPFKPTSDPSLSNYAMPKALYGSPLEPMQGLVAGVQASRFSGASGASLSLRVRGHNHIANSNEPLYVINGMEMESTPSGLLGAMPMAPGFMDPLRHIMPENIESIQVLKGPETARYGQRGANGVILIETKEIRSTYKKWAYNQSLSVQEIANWPALLDASAYQNWAERSQLVPPTLLQGQEQDWQERISRKALATRHQLMRYGDFYRRPYRLLLTLEARQGPIRETSLQRLNVNFSYDWKKGDLRLQTFYNVSLDMGNVLPGVAQGMPGLDLLQSAFSMNPTLRDETMPFDLIQNPLSIQEEVNFRSRGSQHVISLQPSLNGDEWGKLEAVLGTVLQSEQTQVNSPFPISPDPTVSQNNTQTFQHQRLWTSLTYTNTFEKRDHVLDIEVDWKSQFQRRFNINGEFIQLPPFGYGDLSSWPDYASPYTYPNLSVRAYHASSAEAYYKFRKFLRVLAGARAERLQNAQEFNYLVPQKWRLYPFATLSLNPFEWANELKKPHSQFRLSYGQPGWGASRTQSYNAAWDFYFVKSEYGWRGVIKGSLEVYRKDINKVRFTLENNDLGNPIWAGKAVGRIRNEGIELTLNFQPQFRITDLWMVTALNFAFQRNELLRLDDSAFAATGRLITPFLPPQTPRQLAPGESIGSFALPGFLGLDANGNAMLSEARWVGQALPKFIGGLHQRFYYKKWQVEFLFEGAAGFQLLNDMQTALGRQGGLFEGSNFSPAALENDLPPFYEQPFATAQLIEQGDYLRLRHSQLSYTFNWPNKEAYYTRDDGILSFSVQNAFVWTKYGGNDPELALGPLFGAGQDYVSYPLARVWTLGLQLFF